MPVRIWDLQTENLLFASEGYNWYIHDGTLSNSTPQINFGERPDLMANYYYLESGDFKAVYYLLGENIGEGKLDRFGHNARAHLERFFGEGGEGVLVAPEDPQLEEKIDQVAMIGGINRDAAVSLLRAHDGNVQHALNAYLSNNFPEDFPADPSVPSSVPSSPSGVPSPPSVASPSSVPSSPSDDTKEAFRERMITNNPHEQELVRLLYNYRSHVFKDANGRFVKTNRWVF